MIRLSKILLLLLGFFAITGTIYGDIGDDSGPFESSGENNPGIYPDQSESDGIFSRSLGNGEDAILAEGDPPGEDGGPGSVPIDNGYYLIIIAGLATGMYHIHKRNTEAAKA